MEVIPELNQSMVLWTGRAMCHWSSAHAKIEQHVFDDIKFSIDTRIVYN